MTAYDPLVLRFSKGNFADQNVPDAPHVIPSLVSVSATPTKINLSSSSPDAGGLGTRATLNIRFKDHPHSDRLIDPYRSGRSFDPYTKGSFWSKWFRRNPHRFNMGVRIYEGYAGQNLSQMLSRDYVLTGSTPPNESGDVQLQAKDVLSRLEVRKAQWPPASPGRFVSIDGSGNINVNNAVVADYPGPGYVRINDEIFYFLNSVSTSATSVRLDSVVRAAFGTVAATHAVDDNVQFAAYFAGGSRAFHSMGLPVVHWGRHTPRSSSI